MGNDRKKRGGRSSAKSFAVCLPVCFRTRRDLRWRTGLTARMSENRIVVHPLETHAASVAGAAIVLIISVPSTVRSRGRYLVARGSIERVQDASDCRAALVVSVERSRLVRDSRALWNAAA